ncbi:hypothetical protein HanIR_Chr01g0025041 [Helianthus annuus]|nr:hypothetical protein HanIR_Chr01g0025041 [Helianthus annuus]
MSNGKQTPSFSSLYLKINKNLNNTNFLEWHHNLRIVLKMEEKLYILDGPVPTEPESNSTTARKALEKHNEDAAEVAYLMKATMSPELQKNMEDMDAYDMIQQLKGMFQK